MVLAIVAESLSSPLSGAWEGGKEGGRVARGSAGVLLWVTSLCGEGPDILEDISHECQF